MRRRTRAWCDGLLDAVVDALQTGVIQTAIVGDDLLFLWRREMPIRWAVHTARRLFYSIVAIVREKTVLEASNLWNKRPRR